MLKNIVYIFILAAFVSCGNEPKSIRNVLNDTPSSEIINGIELIVLGTLQDGGLPHIGCKKSCCAPYFDNPNPSHKVVSLGIIDHSTNSTYIFEATPDFTEQIKYLNSKTKESTINSIPNGIFITHAHIGHYTGLMYLGKEAKNAKKAMVYCMPKMQEFLSTNGPWSQLVDNQNIVFTPLTKDSTVHITKDLKVIPFTVPHRDEYSETVGFKIIGPNKKVLFIPDIDKWSKWEKSIIEEIKEVDIAFIDGTFYDAEEINYRNIAEIPHPFVIESMELFKDLDISEKAKVHFIHFNHTNPLNIEQSSQQRAVIKAGFKIPHYGSSYSL